MKLKCFTWLCFEEKILTWHNLLKVGFHGPIISWLCKMDLKDISHSFIHWEMPFFKGIWSGLQRLLQLFDDWYGITFNDWYGI